MAKGKRSDPHYDEPSSGATAAAAKHLFGLAGFTIDRDVDGGANFTAYDFLAIRNESEKQRVCAVLVRTRFEEMRARETFEKLHSYLRRKNIAGNVSDGKSAPEFWIIVDAIYPSPRDIFRHRTSPARLLTLDDLERTLFPSGRSRKRPSKTPVAARTLVAKAVISNEKEIIALSASIVALIDEKADALTSTLRNDPDSIAQANDALAELVELRVKVVSLVEVIAQFRNGTAKEAEMVRTVRTFSDGVQTWWSKGHDAILASGFGVALFTTAISIASLSGVAVHGRTATVITGLLAGGKPLVDALKGLGKGLFK